MGWKILFAGMCLVLIKTNVLGTEYEIIESNERRHPLLKTCNGFCDPSVKQCVISDFEHEDPINSFDDLQSIKRKTTRHELIHAFLFESGLAQNSDWATNEEMVDWFAMQFPKLLAAFQDVKCL